MGRQSQCKASKRHYEKNKAEKKEKMREYYRKNKARLDEKRRKRDEQIGKGAYRWNYKIVTGYLPYAQGINKEKW